MLAAASCKLVFRTTYIDIVIQFYAPRAIELDLFQCLAHNVVRLVFRLLGRLDDRGLVEVTLVVEIKLAEGILQAENLALLELGVFPAALLSASACTRWKRAEQDGRWRGALRDAPLQLDHVHGCGRMWSVWEEKCRAASRYRRRVVSASLSLKVFARSCCAACFAALPARPA